MDFSLEMVRGEDAEKFDGVEVADDGVKDSGKHHCKGCNKEIDPGQSGSGDEILGPVFGPGRKTPKDHCEDCYARRRAILAKAGGTEGGELKQWVLDLPAKDPAAYRASAATSGKRRARQFCLALVFHFHVYFFLFLSFGAAKAS